MDMWDSRCDWLTAAMGATRTIIRSEKAGIVALETEGIKPEPGDGQARQDP
jgi:hypothetical protein